MTKTAHHSFLFRLWIHIRGFLAIIIVMFGVVVGLISLILPNENLYKPYVVEFLSKQWNKQVEIKSISGKWQGFGPKFIISDLVIKDEDEVIVQQATLNINVFKYLIPKGSTGISLGISDIEVDFERKVSGKIVLIDKEKDKESFSDKLEKLLATGTLSVDNLTLNLYDSINNKENKINSKITVQQTADKRAFAMELDSQGLADKIHIKAIAEKKFDILKQAKWYMEVDNLSLNSLGKLINKSYLPKAFIEAQLWFDTEKGNIVNLIGKAELKNKLFSKEAEVTGLAELVYSGNNRDWNAELNIKDIKTEFISQDNITIHLSRKESFIYLNADVLDIPLLRAITQVINISNDEFDKLMLNGKLTDVMIKYDVNLRRIVDASIQFQQLNLEASFGVLNNLSGAISLHDEQIRLLIDSDDGSAVLPGFMRGTVNWEKLLLTVQTSMHDDDLDIKINSLWCDCNDFFIDGAARIAYTDQLFLDLTFAVYQAKVNQLYKYWPSAVWKPKVLNFLDLALVSGVVERGMIIYHGFVKQYPFIDNQGVFLTKSHLQEARVNYHKDWPMVSDFNAVVDTVNRRLTVNSNKGQVLQAQIDHVEAVIENMKDPVIKIDINAQGQDNFLIDFLKQSPMKKGLNVLKEDIILSGAQKINVELDIPINRPEIKVVPRGEINFFETDFQMGQFQLQKLNGIIDFKGFSLILDRLNANFLNQNVVVSGQILNEPNKEASIDVLLNGNYGVENFESVLGFSLPAAGTSAWLFSISNKVSDAMRFTASSDLIGVELQIPEPFSKPLNQAAPFSITCTLPCTDSGWDMKFDNKLTTNFQLDSETSEFQLNKLIFGSSDGDFGGQIEVLDVDKWINMFVGNHSDDRSNKLPFQQMSLHINKVIFMARELFNVDVNIFKSEDGISFEIKGDEIEGTIIIANDIDRKGIIVQLTKLHWKAQDIVNIEQTTTPVSSNYPALHVWIGDFIYDGIPLGESSIEVRPVNEGIRVEKFNTKSDLMELNINGIWLRDAGTKGLSKFNIIMTSKDIAQFLTNLGFQAPISEADTIIDMQAQWADFPSQFEIKNISGKMRIEIGEGEVIDAEPGMGRVLGLFSLTNLPRRLILDFRDVFSKGLRFESMQGDFTLQNGEAYTQSFEIDSSSAKITVTGKTGLANQDYNQTVTVTPRVGRVLPTIGAITGGAVGAAAGFFVQGMFRRDLKNIGKIVYKVTGSWDEPIIELIETEEL
ncbi:MAG: hypothetical protein JKY19_15520 [Alcanivoracaceae bacterium]|nr:hypothetical protein [Alcanivoracaceae bacterium]